MNWSDFHQAVNDARSTIYKGDAAACQVANLLVNRLRAADIGPSVLRDLKRELRNFDMVTGTWKDKP